jgi:hypothetical protein
MTDLPDAELLSRFISMGGNCEFGIAQRQCRAEPFDLLRWGQTDMGVALHMLSDRFARIADALTVSVVGGEYILDNHVYRFKWHTFAMQHDTTPERILKREVARLPRQAGMLLDQMADGDRILVRLADHGTSEAGLDRFVSVCGELGPSQILFVSLDPERAGTVERVGPTLLRGYAGRFADPANVAGTTQAGPWITLCRNALALAWAG